MLKTLSAFFFSAEGLQGKRFTKCLHFGSINLNFRAWAKKERFASKNFVEQFFGKKKSIKVIFNLSKIGSFLG